MGQRVGQSKWWQKFNTTEYFFEHQALLILKNVRGNFSFDLIPVDHVHHEVKQCPPRMAEKAPAEYGPSKNSWDGVELLIYHPVALRHLRRVQVGSVQHRNRWLVFKVVVVGDLSCRLHLLMEICSWNGSETVKLGSHDIGALDEVHRLQQAFPSIPIRTYNHLTGHLDARVTYFLDNADVIRRVTPALMKAFQVGLGDALQAKAKGIAPAVRCRPEQGFVVRDLDGTLTHPLHLQRLDLPAQLQHILRVSHDVVVNEQKLPKTKALYILDVTDDFRNGPLEILASVDTVDGAEAAGRAKRMQLRSLDIDIEHLF